MKQKTKSAVLATIPAAARPRWSENRLNWLVIGALFILPLILYHEFLSGARMLYGSDFIGSGGYASRVFMAEYLARHGTFAGWLPYIYCGLPTYAAIFGDIFYPLTVLLRLLLPVHIAWTYTFVLQAFLGGLGMYLFLREVKVPVLGAGLLAIAYMFSGSMISPVHEGHDGRLIVTSLFPLVMFFLEKGFNTRKLIFFLLSGTMIGMQLFSGHLQQVYYTGMIVVFYSLWRIISDYSLDRDKGRLLRMIGSVLLLFGFTTCLVAIQWLPVFGNLSSGVRGASKGWAFATSWSMPPEEIFDLITPRFSGGLDSYWGRNPFKHHTEYLGILPLILALIGIIFTWRERFTRFLTVLLVFTLLMAWGGHTPFYYIPYYLFPGVAKFRAASLIFFVTTFTIVTLAGLGLRFLVGELKQGERIRRFLIWYGGSALGLLLLFAAGQGAVVSILAGISRSDASRIAANYPNFLSGMVIAVVLIGINLALLFYFIRRRLQLVPFVGIAALVLIVDTWMVDTKFIKSWPPPSESFARDEVVERLKQDTTLYRVFPLYYVDPQTGINKADEGLLMMNGIASLGGQHPNPLQRYMDFVGLEKTVMFSFPPNLLNRRLLDLLNCKYVISVPLPDDLSQLPQQSRQTAQLLRQYVSLPGLTMIYYSPSAVIYRNDSVLPRVWFADDYELAPDIRTVLNRLRDNRFDPRKTVLLADNPGIPHPADSSAPAGTVQITGWDADRILVTASLNRPALLVLSENWHPDWQAYDNGQPVKILRAFHTLRALPLSAGMHRIEFRYSSRYFRLGRLLTLFGGGLLLAVLLATLILNRHQPAAPLKSSGESDKAQPSPGHTSPR